MEEVEHENVTLDFFKNQPDPFDNLSILML